MNIVEIRVGNSVVAEAQFVVSTTYDTIGATVTYEVQDPGGLVYVTGTAASISEVALNSKLKLLIANASIVIPEAVPVTRKIDKFKLLWQAYTADGVPIATYVETFSVSPAVLDPFGVPDIVECLISQVKVQAVLPCIGNVDVRIYRGNEVLTANIALAPETTPIYNGNLYKWCVLNSTSLGITESLIPYTVLWEYEDSITCERVSEDGYVYHVNPSILMAAKELQSRVNRSKNGTRLAEDAIDLPICINFLKQGMDMFNSMGMPTYFTMTDATGPMRSYWIACSEVLLLQSQYLLEAERSFNLAGQSVTLDFDITSFYETIASNRQSWLDTYIPDFKKNLNRRGVTDGSGNLMDARSRNVGAIGVTLSPISQFYQARYPRYRGFF